MESVQGTSLAETLNGVDMLVSSVVASTGVALRVLVGHGRAKGIEDSSGCDILRSNQDDGLLLALDLFFL